MSLSQHLDFSLNYFYGLKTKGLVYLIMYFISSNRKNKIVLSDYNYKRDIENRLFMSDLSIFEVDLLREILNSSLKLPIQTLVELFETEATNLYPTFDKFAKIGLLTYRDGILTVDKEMRKYYEIQIEKFEEDFKPGVDYLQSLLNKVPIHILPSWYVIPRSSDNIFSSIVEKCLLTPKVYERYLSELNFDNPVMSGIMKDVMASHDYKLPAHDLRDKYSLSREEFEEIMLHLEFNLVCCLSYQKTNDLWEEVVTPFDEWREYLLFLRDTELKGFKEGVHHTLEVEFGFIQDLQAILKATMQTPLKMSRDSIALDAVKAWIPHLKDADYLKKILMKLTQLNLVEESNSYLEATEWAKEWVKKPLTEMALIIYRLPLVGAPSSTDRDIREGERSLRRAINKGWVYFDEFMKGVCTVVGNNEQITLRAKGKKWKYVLPSYSESEVQLMHWIIFERLFETGIVAVGTHKGRDCFCVTAFGAMAIGE